MLKFASKLRDRILPQPPGITLLLKQSRALNTHVLAALLSDVTGSTVQIGRNAGNCVFGGPKHYAVILGGTTFTIANWDTPYLEDPVEASATFNELRIRKAIREHKAWLSMDVVASHASRSAYRTIGQVVARWIGADCVALYHAPLSRYVPCMGDETIAWLTSDDPIRAVFVEHIASPVFPDDDPRFRVAAEEALRRFSEFETAFHNSDGSDFTIKTRVTIDGASEGLWVEVTSIANGKIDGRLGSKPIELTALTLGAKIESELAQLEDWVFKRHGAPVGMFTLPVIMEVFKKRGS